MNILFSCQFFSVTEQEFYEYEKTYPGVGIASELRKMYLWLRVNPSRRKKLYARFITNWLKRTHNDLLRVELRNNVREYRAKAESRVGTFAYEPVKVKASLRRANA